MSSTTSFPIEQSKVVILMGPPGAGKSTILSDFKEKLTLKGRKAVIVSPDNIKKGMPQYQAALLVGKAAEVSKSIHEESITLATAEYHRQLTETASGGKPRVVIFDGTGSWAPFCDELLSAAETIRMRTSIHLVYADPETCTRRCLEREIEEKRAIPIDRIEPIFNQLMANFIHFRTRVASWKVYNNNESVSLPTSIKPVARKFSKSPIDDVKLPDFFKPHLPTQESLLKKQYDEEMTARIAKKECEDRTLVRCAAN